ncbi:hypothetical protein SAMN06265379_104258 [Saccharicrinis carchari]|uniref:Copper resistance protein D n=1 Tax=Saccharicrinis carchari TaxID=1168039 RepID=A0A521D5F4_SACCC|nr:hypothetical protein [Saccharicrinis carchari]SMO66907.1 hypothetical protein SAMN06265379_104258 [Saccharicrinis carchari]
MRNPMLIVHLLSVVMFVGAALSAFVLSKTANKFEPQLKMAVNRALLTLNYLGKTGLTLLVITGGYLMTPYWAALGVMPLLITKLSVVGVLIVVLVILSIKAKKAKKQPSEGSYGAVNKLNTLSFALGLVTIILAVLVFG